MSVDEAILLTGENTGNLLIGYGLLKQIEHQVFGWNGELPPEQIREKCDLMVIPAANFLFERFDFGWAADIVEKADLPCLMVGLGAQARSTGDDVDVPAGTKRFLKAVADRTNIIGVRGEFTARILNRLGIANIEITGCPSYYSPFPLDLSEFHLRDRFAVTGSRDVVQHSSHPESMRLVERRLMQEAIRLQADYIYQTERPEMSVARGTLPPGEAGEHMLAPAKEFYAGVATPAELNIYWHTHARTFFDIDAWAAAIRRYRFVIGTRFHGNLIALLNGVPATVIAHDARTKEMCEFLALPHIPVEEAENLRIEDVAAKFTWDKYLARRTELEPRYQSFLEANGISHRLKRIRLLSTPQPGELR